jgi:hypothetical protein
MLLDMFRKQLCPKHVEQQKVKWNFVLLKLVCIWLVFIQYYVYI